MSAEFKIIKYTGKSSDFGTEVSSIGIKRVDAAVPAVYGTPVVPGDDRSDAAMYSVYRPEQVDGVSYSFESIFKLKLKTEPDNQLSNIRIYNSTISEISITVVEGTGSISSGDKIVGVTSNAVGTVMSKSSSGNIMTINVTAGQFIVNELISNVYGITNTITSIKNITGSNVSDTSSVPTLYIGTSQSYNIPTNVKSTIATVNILSYTVDNPFLVPVGGVSGGVIEPNAATSVYNLTLNDIGNGNKIYINNVRQDNVQLINDSNRLYTLLDQTNGTSDYALYPVTAVGGDVPIITTIASQVIGDIESGVDGNGRKYIKITATSSLFSLYPDGFIYAKYDMIDNPTFDTNSLYGTLVYGGYIDWLDLDGDPIETITYDVRVESSGNGTKYYTIDGVRQSVLNFELNRIYVFNNIDGDTEPLRFIDNGSDIMAREDNIVLDGVSVSNGGTANEVITVNPRLVLNAGNEILGYQSVNTCELGSSVNNIQFTYMGNYNLNTVGGGTNPASAGETDYIYLQLEVKGNSKVGNYVPEIIIEYDEN